MAETEFNIKKKSNKGDKMLDVKDVGDYMKPLKPFYDMVALEPPFNLKQVERLEARIYKEVETVIRQVRSTRNLSSMIKNNVRTKNTMRKYLEFLEDKASLRIGANAKRSFQIIEKNIKKMVPENFKLSLFPSYFNTTDCERIGTILKDKLGDFLINTTKKVMFCIAIRVFAYQHQVNSVRVCIIKMYPSEAMTSANASPGKIKTPINSKSPIGMAFGKEKGNEDFDTNSKMIKKAGNNKQDVSPRTGNDKRFE